MLNHNDGIVNNQANRRRHPPERHNVEAHIQQLKQQDGNRQNRGHKQHRNHSNFNTAHEQKKHQCCQNNPDGNRIPDTSGGTGNQLALVIPVGHMDGGGESGAIGRQALFDIPDNPDRIAANLLIDLKQYRIMAVGGHSEPFGNCRRINPGNIPYSYHTIRAAA